MSDTELSASGDAPGIDKTLSADEEINAAIKSGSVQETKRQQRKKIFKAATIILPILLIGYGIHWLMKPFEGGMPFGICKVFLELNVGFPQTLKLSSIEEFDTSVRVWYTHIDSFGEYRMEQVQCYYRPDEENGIGYALDRIVFNRNFEVSQREVEIFNKSIPTIFAYPPDLTLPYNMYDSLEGVIFETDKFRKPIL